MILLMKSYSECAMSHCGQNLGKKFSKILKAVACYLDRVKSFAWQDHDRSETCELDLKALSLMDVTPADNLSLGLMTSCSNIKT